MKKNKGNQIMRRLAISTAALLMLVGCTATKQPIRGVIVPTDADGWLPCIDDRPSAGWTPTEDDVRDAEPAIRAYIKASDARIFARLNDYQCQYIGTIVNGKKRIYCNYFCDEVGVDVRKEIIEVEDGGDCYFQFEYEVETGKCRSFSVNGEA